MPDFGNTSVFSPTDADNNTSTMPGWNGSARPSTIDDAGRALQGAVTRQWYWTNWTTTAGGTANAKTLTYTVAPESQYDGQRFNFIANTTNTGAVTLSINGLASKSVKKMVAGTPTALSSGEMESGAHVEVYYSLANNCFIWDNYANCITASTSGTFLTTTLQGNNTGNVALAVNYLKFLDTDTTVAADQTIGEVNWETSDAGGPGVVARIRASNVDAAGGAYMELFTAQSGATALPSVRIDGDGAVHFKTSSSISNLYFADGLSGTRGNFRYRTDNDKFQFLVSGSLIWHAYSSGFGYPTGTGGTVPQATNKSTGVTLSKVCGEITMNNASLASGAIVSFTLTNTCIDSSDVLILNHVSGGTLGAYGLNANCNAGSATIYVRNATGGALGEAIVIRFVLIKAANA